MSARPSHVPICRLPYLVRGHAVSAYRRAERGDYGPVTRDARGRQQVEIARVEQAHCACLTADDIARALSTPAKNKTQIERKRERIRQLDPGPIILCDTGPVKFFCSEDAKSYALGCVQKRDKSWMQLIARLKRLD